MKLKTISGCFAMAALTVSSHGALSFSEDFSDNSASPNMALGGGYGAPISNTTASFNITSGDGNRTYLGTNLTDYGVQDFTFEANVSFATITSAWSMVFLGMGNRDAGGAGAYGEPLTGGAYLMMVVRPDEDASGNLQTRNSTTATGLAFSGIGLTPSSTHKLRMDWNAASNQATFLFDTGNNNAPGVYDFSYTSSVPAGTFNATNSQLFLGGGNGLSFDNILVTVPEPSAALLGGLGVLGLLRRRRN